MSQIPFDPYDRSSLRPYIVIKDPISALTHFIGFIASIIATPVLLSKTGLYHSELTALVSISIYCLSSILLYGASSAYHSFLLPEKKTGVLKRIDHCSIFLLIAGTYTPICLLTIKDKGGVLLLAAIWAAAVIGIFIKLFYVYCPKYVSSIIYVSMGWMALAKIVPIYRALGQRGFFWLLTGGLLYSIGAIIYALKIKISDAWSEHEVFHIFVLLGSICHFIMIFFYVI